MAPQPEYMEDGGVVRDTAVPALEGAEVLDGHHRVGVVGRPPRDVDDHRRADQFGQVQVGGQAAARGEVPGRVQAGNEVVSG